MKKRAKIPRHVAKFDKSKYKKAIFVPASLKKEVNEDWPEEIQARAGFKLNMVQHGQTPEGVKALPDIGGGVFEIKEQDSNRDQYRMIYVAKFDEAVYVFHVITKKRTEKMSDKDAGLARERYKELVNRRKRD